MFRKHKKMALAFLAVAMFAMVPMQAGGNVFVTDLLTHVIVAPNGARSAAANTRMQNPAPQAIRGMRTRVALGNSLAHNGSPLAQTTTARTVTSNTFRTGTGVITTFHGMFGAQNSSGTWGWLNPRVRTVNPR